MANSNLELFINLIIISFQLVIDLTIRLLSYVIPMPQKDISKDVILITGAASGIGRLMAYKFTILGARMIVCWDINEKGNNETVEYINNTLKGKAVGFKINLASRENIYDVSEQTKDKVVSVLNDKLAYVTMLINNAGIVSGKPLLNCNDSMVQLTTDVNLTSHFWTIKAFLPTMLKNNKGHIVEIASAAGQSGSAGLVDYCASKFGVVGIAESLYMEMHKFKKNVNVTVVCPYYISTGMFEGAKTGYPWLLDFIKPDKMVDVIVKGVRRNEYKILHPFLLQPLIMLKEFLGIKMCTKIGDAIKLHDSMDNFVGRHR